jgi:hypothetical protein
VAQAPFDKTGMTEAAVIGAFHFGKEQNRPKCSSSG